MSGYTLYDAQTGIIRTAISGDRRVAMLNRLPSEGLADGEWSSALWYFVNGVPTPLPTTAPTIAAIWTAVRKERDKRLADTDWTQLADAPVDQSDWAIYRQLLRDVPQTNTDPEHIAWPAKPGSTP